MKRIVMVRHASAVPHGIDVEDFNRSLRKKGHKEAARMIEWYREAGLDKPDLMLSSPASRAIETAELFAEGLGYERKKIATEGELYGTASEVDFLEIVRGIDDHHRSVMVFGHDPEFTSFANYMVPDFGRRLPKCSVLVFEVDSATWRDIAPGSGTLRVYESPKGLRGREDG